jgi:8-oxo-dGTP pyrophosphatase MutT (NUDIX family)
MTLSQLLRDYTTEDRGQLNELQRFRALLESAGHAAFDRTHFVPGHITASCWIVDTEGDACLLTHHRKLDRWLQLGGHCDGNPDVVAAAMREAEEESGLTGFTLTHAGIYDLDIHEIPARKSAPAHLHYDVRFALRAPDAGDLIISEESHDLAWVRIQSLTEYTEEESVLRLARKWNALRAST